MTGVLSTRTNGDPGLVVVGMGVAALRVAQTVRAEGYDGPVLLIGAEPHLPYDRPPLSKQVLKGEMPIDATRYHAPDYYADLGVELLTDAEAVFLDAERSRVRLADGSQIPFHAAVVATGSRPRRLPFSAPAEGVHLLRTIADAIALRSALRRGNRLAVVGAGFIGAEVASTAKEMGLEVTVVETASTPLIRAVGASVGAELAALHERSGVRLLCGKAVTGFVGKDRVEGLTLDDGTVLPADIVVVGVGVVSDVEWLETSGFDLSDGLACDAALYTGRGAVFGAGDAISWPLGRRRMRSQQWTTASDQGRHVGRVLVRGAEAAGPFVHDLYFWSDQYGVRIQGAGVMSDPVVLQRSDHPARLIAAYRQDSVITGAVAVNAPREFQALRKLARRSASWGEVGELVPVPSLSAGGAV